jgi:hypothetical protein
VYEHPRCILVKVDVDAIPAREEPDTPETAHIVAGQPLPYDGTPLTGAIARGSEREWLASTRGCFAVAWFEPGVPRLVLATDKLGVRPMYFWADRQFVYFSTALRILENLQLTPKRADIRGVTEVAAFGYPLADRTVYADIVRLHAGEVVEFRDTTVIRRRYWRWDSLRESQMAPDKLARQAYDAFCEAIAVRARGESVAQSFLSGGLDSRCVVAALLGAGLQVHTITLGAEPSQDTRFASAFASAAGTLHHEIQRPASELVEWLPSLPEALARSDGASPRPDSPRLIWSGDGGSVGMGCVYITPQIEERLRNRDEAGAVSIYVHHLIPGRMLAPAWRDALLRVPFEGVLGELNCVDHEDPLQKFYLFLMLNDQRRHLTAFYEHIDLHRVEYQLPFFDMQFLQILASAPRIDCLYHRFYSKWLRCFPPFVSSVPWQAYPGHAPCPLPATHDAYQWSGAALAKVVKRNEPALIRQVGSMLTSRRFPEVLSRPCLTAAMLLHLLKLGKYAYVLRAASAYAAPWRRSSGPGKFSDLAACPSAVTLNI